MSTPLPPGTQGGRLPLIPDTRLSATKKSEYPDAMSRLARALRRRHKPATFLPVALLGLAASCGNPQLEVKACATLIFSARVASRWARRDAAGAARVLISSTLRWIQNPAAKPPSTSQPGSARAKFAAESDCEEQDGSVHRSVPTDQTRQLAHTNNDIPIYIGGANKLALKRAARYRSGWIEAQQRITPTSERLKEINRFQAGRAEQLP